MTISVSTYFFCKDRKTPSSGRSEGTSREMSMTLQDHTVGNLAKLISGLWPREECAEKSNIIVVLRTRHLRAR